jgi:hypothetical protein
MSGDPLRPPRPARGHRRWPALVTAAAVLAVAVAVTAAVLLPRRAASPAGPAWPALPPGTSMLTWPITGDAASDTDLAGRAQAAWNAHASAHRDVRPLLLHRHSPTGPLAILQGRDSTGNLRLAILTGVYGTGGDRSLVVRADRPLPDPAHTAQISLVTAKLGEQPGELPEQRGHTLAVALAAPTADRATISCAICSPQPAAATRSGRLTVTVLPWEASAFTTRITTYHDDQVVAEVTADDDTIGTRRAHRLTITRRVDDNTLLADGNPAKPGQLVSTTTGVVGTVRTATGPEATINLLTHPDFQATVTGPGIGRAIIGHTSTGLGILGITGSNHIGTGVLLSAYDIDGLTLLPVARLTTTPQPTAGPQESLTATADLTAPGDLFVLDEN